MAKFKLKEIARPAGWIALGVAVIFLLGGSRALYDDTLIDWWKPVGACALLAVISSLAMSHRWKKFTCSDFAPINFTLHAIVSFTVLIFAFFSVNYFFADDKDLHTENVTVEHRYRETRYHTKRVGRRTVGRGTPYYVYSIEVRFSNGRLKTLPVSKKRHDRLRANTTIPLEVETGYLGIPVIKTKYQ